MTFIEWWHSQGFEDFRPESSDLVRDEIVKKAWDYQQERLDCLLETIKELI